MSIETKSVRLGWSEYGEEEDQQRYLKQLPAFGWQYTQEHEEQNGRCRNHYAIYARDNNMPNYLKLVQLENKYEDLRKQLEKYQPMDGIVALICLACLIIPGVIYISFKLSQKSRKRKWNDSLREEMDKIVYSAQSIKKK